MIQSTKYIAVVLIVAALFVVAVRFASPRWFAGRPTNISPSNEKINGLLEIGDSWLREVELTHAADQYDCLESAAKQLASKLAEFVQDNQQRFEETVFIRVHFEDSQLPSETSARLVMALEHSLPLALLEFNQQLNVQLLHSTATSVQKDEAEAPVELRIATLPTGSKSGRSPENLVLAASVFFDQRSSAFPPLQIAAKNWIRQWSAYRNHPDHQHLRLFRAETLDQARTLLVQELASEWCNRKSNNRLVQTLSRDQASKLIQQQLSRLDLQVDQFEQVFQLQMQDGSQIPALTRAALLVDLSPQRMDAVQSLLDSSSHRQRERFWSRLNLLGVLAAVLMIAVLGLDRLTLGYYSWRIRGVAILLASGIFVLLA